MLARLPGMSPEMAARVVGVREMHGPYASLDELSLFADLPPALTDQLAHVLVFLR